MFQYISWLHLDDVWGPMNVIEPQWTETHILSMLYAQVYMCNELRGIMARSTQFPNMITRSTIIYEIVSPGAAGSSIYI